MPTASSIEQVFSIRAHFAFDGIYLQPAIRLADADIAPVSCLAGIDDCRTKIERIEQDRNIKLIRNTGGANNLTGQFSQLLKWDLKAFGVFSLDIKPTTQGNRNAAIEQTGLENRMTHTVFAAGVMMNLAHRLHLFCPLDGLRIINDQQAFFAAFSVKPFEQGQSFALNDSRLVELTAPEKFTVIRAVGTVSQQIDQPFDGAAMADTNGQNQATIIAIT